MKENLRIANVLLGIVATLAILWQGFAFAQPKVGENAPSFSLKDHEGKLINLEERKGKGWTVLFFYPKAGTPGCTKQACAFRDSVKIIRDKNAEIFGISADSVAALAKFHKEHHLSFRLLSDESLETIDKYSGRTPQGPMAARQTFIISPELKVAWHEKEVDPALDAKKVAEVLQDLQKGSK